MSPSRASGCLRGRPGRPATSGIPSTKAMGGDRTREPPYVCARVLAGPAGGLVAGEFGAVAGGDSMLARFVGFGALLAGSGLFDALFGSPVGGCCRGVDELLAGVDHGGLRAPGRGLGETGVVAGTCFGRVPAGRASSPGERDEGGLMHSTRRQVRAWSVRQPRPRRVRARRPQPRRWWSRVDWAKTAAVFGIVAGVVTLALTAVATYYGARVGADQLAQSREDAERQKRGQASRVTTWADRNPDGSKQLHVANRTHDPVFDVEVDFRAYVPYEGDPDPQVGHLPGEVRQVHFLPVKVEALGPCSEIVIEAGELFYPKGRKLVSVAATQQLWLSADSLMFRDSTGIAWQRTGSRLREGEVPIAPDTSNALPSGRDWMVRELTFGVMREQVAAIPIPSCGGTPE